LAVCRYLPTDLSLYHAEPCSSDFHPRYDVVSKEYLYRIINKGVYDPFEYGRAWFVPRPITEEGISLMQRGAEHIIGKHDFAAFMSEGSDASDTVRCVKYVKIDKKGDIIEIRIAADGFLYNMVRIMVGTLAEVAEGHIPPESIPERLASLDRTAFGRTAPAEGLYLNRVFYNDPEKEGYHAEKESH
jgi:tRNA pseudouridine38-40 synthase